MTRSTQEMTTALRQAGERLQRNLQADAASLFEWAEMADLSDAEQIARLTAVTESFLSSAGQHHSRTWTPYGLSPAGPMPIPQRTWRTTSDGPPTGS